MNFSLTTSKITIKPYLNTTLQPKEVKGKYKYFDRKYPLYYQITFERKNTQIKSHYNMYFGDLQDVYNEEPGLIEFESEILTHIICYEKVISSGTFELSGIKLKYEKYLTPINNILEEYFKKKLVKAASQCYSEYRYVLRFDSFDVRFTTLFGACEKLFPEIKQLLGTQFGKEYADYRTYLAALDKDDEPYSYLSLIHWHMNDYKTQLYHNLLIKMGTQNEAKCKDIVHTMDKIINQYQVSNDT
ncbi:MAG: hypothetical protein NW207_12520 [Cytophagales bacterium]|nr:hypothetical protein [Cytophagales bacterium]